MYQVQRKDRPTTGLVMCELLKLRNESVTNLPARFT